MITLIIARHGNTFESDEPVRRVGLRTDLPLTRKGHEQAKALGRALLKNHLIPDSVYCSELKRTRETASSALSEMNIDIPITTSHIFNEVDYGIDENKLETEVIKRLGTQSILDWDENFIVPEGWIVNIEDILHSVQIFVDTIIKESTPNNRTILIVTSNGIGRFFTKITPMHPHSPSASSLKLGTGCYAKMSYNKGLWSIDAWNIKPE